MSGNEGYSDVFRSRGLATDELRVVVDERGLITSIYDKLAERELVPPGGAANLLQLHRDTPT